MEKRPGWGVALSPLSWPLVTLTVYVICYLASSARRSLMSLRMSEEAEQHLYLH